MTALNALERAVHQASAALAADPDGSLPLVNRRAIWRAFCPVEVDDAGVRVGDGLQRRVALADSVVRRVLPAWTRTFPGDGRPIEILETARGFLAGALDTDAARAVGEAFWDTLDSLAARGTDLAAVHVGYAAATVPTLATNDLYGIGPAESEDPSQAVERDEDLDPYTWDASFFAAGAAACGSSGEQGNPQQRRMAFWRWYLDEAVPAAWSAVVVSTTG